MKTRILLVCCFLLAASVLAKASLLSVNNLQITDPPPKVSISSAEASTTYSNPIRLNASFSEPVSGFSAADITVSNRSISALQTTDSLSFHATVTPAGDGEIQLSVAENAAFDLAGNGNLASEVLTSAYDATFPTATFSSEYSARTNHSPISLDLKFSEQVSSLSAEDLQLTNATVTNLQRAEPEFVGMIGTNLANRSDYIRVPSGLAYDRQGNLYVAATYANQVKIYDESMSLIATLGDGSLGKGNHQFSGQISDVFIDQHDNIYVVDQGNHQVQIYDQQQQYIATIGSGEAGISEDHLRLPSGVTVDLEGRIYIVDRSNHRVQIFDAQRNHIHTLGETGVLGNQNTQFYRPTSVAISDEGFIYVVDQYNDRIQVFDPQFEYYTTLGGVRGSENDQFSLPTDVALDSDGNIYVADARFNNRIQVYDKDLNFIKTIPATEWGISIRDLYVKANGEILYSDDIQIVFLDQNANLLSTFGSDGSGKQNDKFSKPVRTAVYAQHRLYVADEENHRVQVFDQDLNYIHTINGDEEFNSYEKFVYPTDVAVDKQGRIFVADSEHHTVHIYDSSFVHIETIYEPSYSADKDGSFGIDIDQEGRLYIADTYRNIILIYDQNFEHQATIGTGNSGSGLDQFNNPRDVAVDKGGTIYIADASNQRIQVFDANLTYKETIDYTEYGFPYTLDTDGMGNIYVLDWNNAINVFDAKGNYSHRLRNEAPLIDGDSYFSASGITIGEEGTIYIADYELHNVKIYRPQPKYHLEVSPIADGEVVVELPANATTDLMGNGNEAARFSILYDGSGPLASFNTADSLSSQPEMEVEINFNEPVSGFSVADITVSNGSISALQTTDSLSFLATVTPAGDGEIQLSVAENVAFDLAGNGNLASDSFSLAYDGILPSAAFTTELPSLTNQSPIVVDLTFSEQLSGLSKDDFQLSNGSISSLSVPIPVYSSTVGAQIVDDVLVSTNQFKSPVEVHTDSKNRLYVADRDNNRIQIFDSNLKYLKSLQGVEHDPGISEFRNPEFVAVDLKGNIYIPGLFEQRIVVYDSALSYKNTIYTDGQPFKIDIGPNDYIYVTDNFTRLMVYDNNYQHVVTIDPEPFFEGSTFNRVYDVAVDKNGNIYLTCLFGVQIYDQNYNIKAILPFDFSGNIYPSPFKPNSIEVDAEGNIYLIDAAYQSVKVFNPELEYLYSIGNGQGINSNQFSNPQGIAINDKGFIYVADQDNHRIQVFTPPVKYQMEITPAADGEVVVELPANATTDLMGNGNEAARFSILYDGSGPLANFSSADSLSSQPDVEVEINFDEPVSGLQASSFILTNATLENLQTTDSTHFTTQLRAEEEGYLSITLDSASVRDRAGNLNTQSAGLLLQYRIPRDTLAPSIEIRSAARDTVEGEFVVEMIFSEQVSGFDPTDIMLNNASILSLASTDSTLFSATVTPLEKGMISLNLGENVATDSAGNGNLASDIFSMYYDENYTLSLQVTNEAGTDIGTFTATLYQRVNGRYVTFTSQEVTEGNAVQFAKIPEGEYTLGVQSVDASLLTTYLGDKPLLTEAQTIYLDRNLTQSITFVSAAVEQSEGIASISGILLKDVETTSGGRIVSDTQQLSGTPLVNVKVYLLNADTEQIIASDVTDAEGKFSFTKLPQGEYLLVADHEGLPNDKQANRINIAADTELVSLTAIVGADVRVAQVQEEKQITSVAEEVFSLVRYYPNPVIDRLKLEISPDWLNAQLSIQDKLGRMLINTTLTSEISEVDFTHLPAGVYIISILKGKSYHSFKISK